MSRFGADPRAFFDTVLEIGPATLESPIAPVPAIRACVERLPPREPG